MLKRRPIRVKLIVALALLSAIVLLLAFSGIWGLYQYRPVSNAIRQRTTEITWASGLHQRAETLKQSYEGATKVPNSKGMIEATSLINRQKLKWAAFEQSMIELHNQLNLHAAVTTEQSDSALLNTQRQQRKLGEIRETLAQIELHYVKPHQFQFSTNDELDKKLGDLVSQTKEHLATIESAMEEVSDYVDDQYRTWIAMALTCTILAFLMVGILLWACRSLVLKPFRTLLDGSRLVAGGQFDHRIDLGTGDELSELADAMNDMTDRFQGALAQVKSWCTDLDRQVQQRTREVIQNEQLASVGFLAAGVAHEINNPLATIAWSAESLQSRLAEIVMLQQSDRVMDDEMCQSLTTNLRRIEEEAYRCKGITEKLLDFSRLSEVQRGSTDLVELVSDVVAMVGKIGKYRCKTLRVHTGEPVIAQVNPQEIRQVLLNLVTNALESVDCDGAVDVYCKTENGFASVVVQDNGCGMTREVLQHIFEPFFTRRRDGTGTGLGLSITYRIVSQHGGSLIASSDGEDCGSTMEMLLPLTADDTENENGTGNEKPLPPGAAVPARSPSGSPVTLPPHGDLTSTCNTIRPSPLEMNHDSQENV